MLARDLPALDQRRVKTEQREQFESRGDRRGHCDETEIRRHKQTRENNRTYQPEHPHGGPRRCHPGDADSDLSLKTHGRDHPGPGGRALLGKHSMEAGRSECLAAQTQLSQTASVLVAVSRGKQSLHVTLKDIVLYQVLDDIERQCPSGWLAPARQSSLTMRAMTKQPRRCGSEAAGERRTLEVLRADLTLPKGLALVIERMENAGNDIVSVVHCAATACIVRSTN